MNKGISSRTFGWYCRHVFVKTSQFYSIKELTSDDFLLKDTNLPSYGSRLKVITDVGLHDVVVTPKTITPLLESLEKWWRDPKRDWYSSESSLRLIISNILHDDTLDPEVVRTVYEKTSFMTISVVSSPSCPPDIITRLVTEVSGTKNDPTKETNGGELTSFVLTNRFLSSDLVDLCSLRSKKIKTLEQIVHHSNVSRSTLVRMFHDPKIKSETLKMSIVSRMIRMGWLEVK